MSEFASGLLSHYFGYSVILTLPVSLALLARYRRELLRGMLATGRGDRAPATVPRPAAATGRPPDSRPRPPDSRSARVRLAVVYVAAALASSSVATALLFLLEAVPASATQIVGVGYVLSWPLAATLPAVLALPRRRALLLTAGWFLLGALLLVLTGLVTGGKGALALVAGFAGLVALIALIPWIVVMVTGSRKLRPVSPMVLAGMLVFSFGAHVVQQAFFSSLNHEGFARFVLGVPWAGTLWFLLAALPVGLGCWLLLRWIGRRYEAKTFSDVQLVVDGWWLIAAFSTSTFLAVVAGWRGLFGLFSFVVYRIVVEVGLRLWPLATDPAAARRLLLLRVFGFRRRTERLFDAIAQRWRFLGSVHLIAGTDLAGRTVDPGEMIRFLAGEVEAQFVTGPADLAHRLETLDEHADPDGRFRINDVSCHDDTWKPTLEALLARSDVVLMDLRGFREERSGCRFELERLAASGRLASTLFVVDDTTDVALLRSVLAGAPELHLVRVERQTAGALAAVETRLRALAGV